MPTSLKLSKEFFIQIGGNAIAKATDFSLSNSKEIIDVTTLDSNGWKEKLVDLKDWTFNFSGLVVRGIKDGLSDYVGGTTYALNDIVTYASNNYIYISQQGSNTGHDPSTDDGTWWKKYLTDFSQLLEDLINSENALDFALTTGTASDKYQYGSGYLTSLEASGTVGDKVTYSGTIEGSSALSIGTV